MCPLGNAQTGVAGGVLLVALVWFDWLDWFVCFAWFAWFLLGLFVFAWFICSTLLPAIRKDAAAFGPRPRLRQGELWAERLSGFGRRELASQKLNRTGPQRTSDSEFNPTTKMGSKMGGEFTYQPKWDPKTVWTSRLIFRPRTSSDP